MISKCSNYSPYVDDKFTIIIDMDEVLVDFLTPLLYNYQTHCNKKIYFEDIVEYNLEKYEFLTNMFLIPGFFMGLELFPGAKDVLQRLVDEGFEIIIASNPSGEEWIAFEKIKWVKKNIPFVGIRNLILTAKKDKIIGDVMFDDGLHYLEGFKGIKVINDRPYNRNKELDYRIYDNDWGQFYEIIKELKKQREV